MSNKLLRHFDFTTAVIAILYNETLAHYEENKSADVNKQLAISIY